MDAAQRWQRAQDVFHAALDLPAAERRGYVQGACGGDAALREQVLGMLAADDEGHALLDGGLAAAADQVLAASPAPFGGQAFGPYRVVGVLGEGGMGVVVRARRDDLGAEAAIKILRDSTLSPARRERFAFEQRALAQLDHPAIARLFDADVLPDGTPWFAMELVDGVPLNEYCRTHALPVEGRLRLFRDVCEAVRHAHARAILHRDLKPSNILVRPDGSPKLLDFGISKPLEAVDDAAQMTRTGMRMMTPAYASPEQARGEGLGVHSDVYSLGVVLHELLTDRLPFDLAGRTPSEAATVLTQQPARRPSAVAAETGRVAGLDREAWKDLDVLCLTAMHRDIERRYRTVDALIADVDRYLAGQPLVARGDAFGYRARKFVRRHAGAVTAAAAALVVLVGMTTFYTLRLAAERDRAEAQARRTERIQSFMTELFQGGDAQAGPTDTLRVVTLLEKGLLDARELGAEPAVQAALERTLGEIFLARGDMAAADSALSRAVRHTPPTESADVVSALCGFAMLRSTQERWDDAERAARDAVARAKRDLPDEHRGHADAIGTLGRVLSDRGEFEQAVPLQQEAIRRYARSPKPTPELLATISDLANSYYYLGRVAESDSLNRRLVGISRQVYGARHPHVADDLINIGIVQSQLGRYAAADSSLREAYDIVRGWYGPDSPQTADAAVQVARNLQFLKKPAEADSLLRGALVVIERAYGPDHARVAGVLTDLGNADIWTERYGDAEQRYRRAVEIYRRCFGPHHERVGVALANLGDLFMNSGDPRRAEGYLREALVAYDGAVPANHYNVGVTRVKLGRVLLMQRRIVEGERESLAAFRILEPQVDSTNNFLQGARNDLFVAYRELGRPQDALRYRPDLADQLKKK